MAVSDESGLIPDELFQALATLVARLMFVCEDECGLSPIELLTIWHIKHFGKNDEDGKPVVRRNEITRMLKEKFRYTDPDVTRLLDGLRDSGVIERPNLSASEQRVIFGEKGPAAAVKLTPKGRKAIESFKEIIRSRADTWVSAHGKPTRSAIYHAKPLVKKLSQWIIKRYEPHGEKRSQ
jgi:DNA-binding MarR family transcriptional regulator